MSARAAWRLESLGFTPVYRYTAGKADWLAYDLPWEGEQKQQTLLGVLARRDVPTCALPERTGEVRQRVVQAGWDICVVLNDQHVVLGLLTAETLQEDAAQTAEAAMKPGPITYRPDHLIQKVGEFMSKRQLTHVLVTKPDGTLIGAVTRAAIAQAAEKHSDEDLSSSTSRL